MRIDLLLRFASIGCKIIITAYPGDPCGLCFRKVPTDTSNEEALLAMRYQRKVVLDISEG